MSVVLVESFDHYSSHLGGDISLKGWNGAVFDSVTGRDGIGSAIQVIFDNPVYKQLGTDYGEFTLGAAIKITGFDGEFMRLEHSGNYIGAVGVNSDGHLYVQDAAARTYEGTTIIRTFVWMYVEFNLTVGTSEPFEVRLNGGTTAEISGTGDFGTDGVNRVVFLEQALGGMSTFVDDVYGTDDGTFLGDIVVRVLYPRSDGTYSQWTPDSGTDHYSRVNEHIFDGDGSFVYDDTVDDKDSYFMDTLGAATIYAVQLNLGARKGDAGLREIAPIIRQAGSDHVGPTETLSTDYAFYSWLLNEDPTSAAWTQATVNADEFGMKVIS